LQVFHFCDFPSKGIIMNYKLVAPLVLGLAIASGSALADSYYSSNSRHHVERHSSHSSSYRSNRLRAAPPRVVYRRAAPTVVYRSAPTVVYEEPVVVYRDTQPVYVQPAPRYYTNSNRASGQVLGAVVGGVVGNQLGRGHHGRAASTAAGAILGGIIGGELAD
jgi:uncharacterized protein YcfJ